MQKEIEETLKVLSSGGTILYPTDTIWGLGCDASNIEAINKIRKIKNRPNDKSFILLVSDDHMLEKYVNDIPNVSWDIIDMSDKPVTIIYDKPYNLPEDIIAEDNTIAIRITNDPFCKALIRKLKKPLVSTSANISGQVSPKNFHEISNEIKNSVDYIVNWRQDDTKNAKASSIIKIKTNGEVKIIR